MSHTIRKYVLKVNRNGKQACLLILTMISCTTEDYIKLKRPTSNSFKINSNWIINSMTYLGTFCWIISNYPLCRYFLILYTFTFSCHHAYKSVSFRLVIAARLVTVTFFFRHLGSSHSMEHEVFFTKHACTCHETSLYRIYNR